MVDDFSKLCILRILTDLTSAQVTRCFMENVVCLYGKPSRVRVDSGSEFAGEFSTTMKLLGIQLITTSPFAPWTNGIAESMVKFSKNLIKKAMTGMPRE